MSESSSSTPTKEALLEEWANTPSAKIDPATYWQRKAFALAESHRQLQEALEAIRGRIIFAAYEKELPTVVRMCADIATEALAKAKEITDGQ